MEDAHPKDTSDFKGTKEPQQPIDEHLEDPTTQGDKEE
jgi:hypothetical protein